MRKLLMYLMLSTVQTAQKHSQARTTSTTLSPSSFTLASGHTSSSPLLCLLDVYLWREGICNKSYYVGKLMQKGTVKVSHV